MIEDAIRRTHRSPGQRTLLIYSSCYAEQLTTIFTKLPEFNKAYHINAFLIHVAEQNGLTDLAAHTSVRALFADADAVITNPWGEKWGNKGLGRIAELTKPGTPVFKFLSPNFAAFWPIVPHFGEHGVIHLWQQGATENDIIEAFDHGTFTPFLRDRFAGQIQRLRDREVAGDTRMADFVQNHHRTAKMWFTENHPGFHVMSWVASQLLALLGLPHLTEAQCLEQPHDGTGKWNAHPETDYEWRELGLTYPQRYRDEWGGSTYYHGVIREICTRIRERGIPADWGRPDTSA